MVEVYGKKASQVNAQRSQCKESKGRKEREKKSSSPRGGIEPTTLHKDPLLQLLYEYHKGYIFLISDAHEGEREKVL